MRPLIDRRRFLTQAVALAGGGTLAALPWAGAFAANRGQAKIAEIRAYAVPKAVFVQVVSDDGTSGWGEAGHEGGADSARLVNGRFDSLLEGTDVFNAEAAWDRVYFEADELGPSGLAAYAMSGIDNALWDLRGKLLGVPVWRLIGGKYRDDVELYGSFSRDNGEGGFLTPAQCAARAESLVELGFKTIKVRMAIREERRDPADDPMLPCMRAIRRAVGDGIALYADPNEGYSVARAIRVGRQLEDEIGIAVYESPVAAFNLDGLGQVVDALDVEVASGELLATRWQFRDLITRGRVDVINPDLAVLGGITEGKKIAALAEAFDRGIAVHNARPTLLTAAHLHYLASCRTADRPQEHPGPERLKELWRFFAAPLPWSGGRMAIPDGPGIGLEVDEAAVRREAQG
ncbi:MAG: mandelate racemase/muconate lactonizing enzyme family protein [Silanimonas sp.]